MFTTRPLSLALVLCLSGLTTASDSARDLSFAERVDAQRIIDRIYYSHQLGATRPFEEAVPFELSEKKVRTYLKQSVALERIWKRDITFDDLKAEHRRMVERTRMPDRLAELQSALGDDPLLVLECLVRPVLVDRLVREAFSNDRSTHGEALRKATYAAPRMTWDAWWNSVKGSLDDRLARTPDQDLPRELEIPWRLHPASSCQPEGWNNGNLATPGIMRARGGHQALWTGTHMIVWNGDTSGLDLNGDKYDPVTDSGVPLSTTGGPTFHFQGLPYVDHAVVWTGQELLFWGTYGFVPSFMVGAGWRYEPMSDTWREISRDGAPIGRLGLNAVWTGSRMMLVGGYSFVQFGPHTVSSSQIPGGLYDPVSNTWGPGPGFNRVGALALRAGDTIIVWGGNCVWGRPPRPDEPNPCNPPPPRGLIVTSSGFPSTQMSTLNAPGPGDAGVAVWTGSDMIVWGGADPVASNRGARFNPAANQWTSISTLNAPSARRFHTGVWTGEEMVVWGGWTGSVPLGTGGRYNPTTDAWTPVPTLDAPSPRYRHTAVWTGSDMIVWGGYNLGALSTGGRYAASSNADADGDGVGECTGDCDDSRRDVYPGAPQICGDGLNNDCLHPSWPAVYDEVDDDRDGYAQCEEDCDDANPVVYPGAPQICDGFNNDCFDTSYPEVPLDEIDDDGDLAAECAGDCDDAARNIRPGAIDLPGNAFDENCDGILSCNPALPWKDEAALKECVANRCKALLEAGLVSDEECKELVRRAGTIQMKPDPEDPSPEPTPAFPEAP